MYYTTTSSSSMEENGTLLRRVLQRAARTARYIALLRPPPAPSSPPTPATPTYSSSGYWPSPSLLHCTDDDDDDEGSFRSAASNYTPAGEPWRGAFSSPGADDVDRRAAEFIERFFSYNNDSVSLDLPYSPSPATTPVMPPMSPDTFFNLSRLPSPVRRGHGAPPVHPLPPPPPCAGTRASGMSIRWPSGKHLRKRPTVQVYRPSVR